MAAGVKTGGRTRGVPNKATSEVVRLIDRLAGQNAMKCFKALAEIAFSPTENVKARLLANRTLIEYRHGRPRESLEVSGPEGGPVMVRFVDA